ncbi:MAG: ATP-binding cassette domain-containing protein [Pseudomonadota bacterium]
MIRAEALHLIRDSFALNASFELVAGSSTALIGPSGAGKSTLLDTMAGFLRSQSGALWLDGRDHTGTAPSDRPVSLLFQDNNLFPHLTVAENIGLGVRSDLRLSSEDHRRVTEIQERLGLAGLGKRLPRAPASSSM